MDGWMVKQCNGGGLDGWIPGLGVGLTVVGCWAILIFNFVAHFQNLK
jgi:hypothetical protein